MAAVSTTTTSSSKQPIGYITRVEQFSSAHRLHSPALSDEENKQLYGPCNNPNGHGHNYQLKVTLRGPVDPLTGMVMNISDMKVIIQRAVFVPLDHKNIDLDCAYFRDGGVVSTAENISVFIWNNLRKEMGDNADLLYEVKLHETMKNIAIYRGETTS